MSIDILPLASFKSEGGLLPPEDARPRIAALDRDLPGRRRPVTTCPRASGTAARPVSRSWSRLIVAWRTFRADLERLPPGDLATTLTRERFLLYYQELGYGRLRAVPSIEVDGREYAITHGYGHVPIHLLGARVSLEDRQRGGGRAPPAARRTASCRIC